MTDPVGDANAPVVHLHIGTMKSGTSYVQGVLEHQQAELAALGVRYPGNTGRAVNDVLDRRGTPPAADGVHTWDELVADVRAWTGTSVIVSMEFLGLASPAQIDRIVASLRPSSVRVVLTARDIGRTLPSAWQQTTKNRGTTTWPDFLASVMATSAGGAAPTSADAAGHADPDEDPADATPDPGGWSADPADAAENPADAGGQFWRHHDVVAIARRWTAVLDPADFTVVTVPPAGSAPELLWRRFARATGIEPKRVAARGGGRGNPSLGLAEAELLRRLNGRLEGKLDGAAYRRIVTGVMSRRVLRGASSDARVPALPPAVADWALRHGESVRSDLAALGVRVVGDLDELVPRPDDLQRGGAPGSSEVGPDELAHTAVSAAAALAVEIAQAQARRRQP